MSNRSLDAKTIKSFINGSEAAQKMVYERYFPIVYTWGKRDLRDPQLVDDYVLDVFCLVWRNRKSIGDGRSFDHYLFSTAHYLLYIHLKQVVRECIGKKDHLESCQSKRENKVDWLMREQDIQEYFNRELDRLSPRRKEIFILSREKGLSALQIAERLNIAEQTVYNQLSRAGMSLRASMASGEDVLGTGVSEVSADRK